MNDIKQSRYLLLQNSFFNQNIKINLVWYLLGNSSKIPIGNTTNIRQRITTSSAIMRILQIGLTRQLRLAILGDFYGQTEQELGYFYIYSHHVSIL